MAQHTRVLVAVGVEVALEHDAVLGEGAGLVAAQYVHSAEVLDRRQLLDDDLTAGKVLGALRQARGHDDGKHLRRDAHGHARGEQQRIVIARAVLNSPAIILADEPTGNLDSKTSTEVLGLIKRTSAEFRQTVVMITHNDDIARLADRIVRIEDGRIVE